MVFNAGIVTSSLTDCQEVLVALDLSEDVEPLGKLMCTTGTS